MDGENNPEGRGRSERMRGGGRRPGRESERGWMRWGKRYWERKKVMGCR